MASYDLVVRGGTVANASDVARCDVAISGGRVVALGEDLPRGEQEIDASGLLVLPGGVDGHCHIEQHLGHGAVSADDFYSATVSAAFGGTTMVIPFAAQPVGGSLRRAVDEYHELARPKAVIDYAFHLIVGDPSPQVLGQELPALIASGYTSLKIYMTASTRPAMNDRQMLDVFEVARREGAMMMVHAENHEMIQWLTDRLLDRGHRAPQYFTVSHPKISESEATHRAISLAELIDVPILIVHVSTAVAMEEIRRAQTRGLKVYAETCPQYLLLTAKDLEREGMEGAKFCCSPPPRDETEHRAVWHGIANGTLTVFSSDHAPYRFDQTGKLASGPNPSFKDIPRGVPGIETRLPLLFSEGVRAGRMDITTFVAITATNPAKMYGLHPRKGTIAVGSDADIAIWDPDKKVTITYDLLHDNSGYTPYEGRVVTGWPVTVLSRGRVVVRDGALQAERGSGMFIPCDHPQPAVPLGRQVTEANPATNFGANLIAPAWAGRAGAGDEP